MNQASRIQIVMTNQQHNTTQKIIIIIIIIIIPNNYCWICSFVIRNCYILPICFQATSWDPNVDFAEDDMMGMSLKIVQCTL